MTDLPDDYPGTPSLDALAETVFGLMQLVMTTSRQNVAMGKVLQALVQDLSARDPEIVDRLRRVFEISNIPPDIMPDIQTILSGITRPDDPRAVHEDDIPAKAH